MKTKTMYCVTFKHMGSLCWATLGNKPNGVFQPERRCAFDDVNKALKLKEFLKRESSFEEIKARRLTVKYS